MANCSAYRLLHRTFCDPSQRIKIYTEDLCLRPQAPSATVPLSSGAPKMRSACFPEATLGAGLRHQPHGQPVSFISHVDGAFWPYTSRDDPNMRPGPCLPSDGSPDARLKTQAQPLPAPRRRRPPCSAQKRSSEKRLSPQFSCSKEHRPFASLRLARLVMIAWATGLRTKATCFIPGDPNVSGELTSAAEMASVFLAESARSNSFAGSRCMQNEFLRRPESYRVVLWVSGANKKPTMHATAAIMTGYQSPA